MCKSPSKKTPVASFKCSLSYSGSLSRPIKDIMRATDRQTDIRREWEVSLPINEENPFKSNFSICWLTYLQGNRMPGRKRKFSNELFLKEEVKKQCVQEMLLD